MKNNFKKSISVLLAVAVIFGSFVFGFSNADWTNLVVKANAEDLTNGTYGENLTWSFNEETGTLTIGGTGDMENHYNQFTIPWYDFCSKIKTVIIEDGVTSIGNCVFSDCAVLASITIPDSVTSIGEDAFSCCEYLTEIVIPAGVTSIGEGAFVYCEGLTSITVNPANTVYSSDEYGVLFNKDKTELIQYPIGNTRTSYAIPDSVTRIGDSAFLSCDNLTNITIGDKVTSIGEYAFSFCKSLTNITIPNNVIVIGKYAFEYCTALTSVSIGEGVKVIDFRAFSDCSGLTNITIPDNVEIIGDYAFSGCDSIASVALPGSVTSIGAGAFGDCDNLTSITTDSANTLYSSDEQGVLFNKDRSKLIQYPIGKENTNYIVPDSVTHIDDYAFWSCPNLTKVTIDGNVTNIGDYAFSHSDSLTTIIIGDSVTHIGDGAFSSCSSLTSISMGDNVTYIGDYAFENCEGLTSITIPGAVSNIGEGVFSYCKGLTSITIPNSIESIGDSAFADCTGLTSVMIPNGVKSIGNSAFDFCVKLKKITIPYSVTSIGSKAFNHCWDLASITIPDSVTSIGDGAFSSTSYYGNANNWKNGVLYINNHIIEAKSSMISGSFYVREGIKSIADNAFIGCVNLTSIVVDDANTSYSSDEHGVLFDKNKTKLILYPAGNERKSYEIPDSVTTIEDYAFYKCYNLTGVTLSDNITSIGDSAFERCSRIVDITIPDRVTSIGESAFSSCSSLPNMIVPDSVISIEQGAFYYCYSMEYIHIPSVTQFDASIFDADSKKEEAIKKFKIELENASQDELAQYSEIGLTEEAIANWKPTTVICSDAKECDAELYAKLLGNQFVICGEIHGVSVPEESTTQPATQTTTEPKTQPVEIPTVKPTEPNTEPITHPTTRPTETTTEPAQPTTKPTEPVTEPSTKKPAASVLAVSVKIKTPSQSTINYGDSIILHADTENLPEGAYIKWSVSSGNFKIVSRSVDSKNCTITPEATGADVITATVYDADGNEISSDTQTMTAKAGFFQKIIAFFKKLFGLTKVIPEVFKF